MAISHNPALNRTIPAARFDLPSCPLRLNVMRAGVVEASTASSPKTTTLTSSPSSCRSEFPNAVSRQTFGVTGGSLSFEPFFGLSWCQVPLSCRSNRSFNHCSRRLAISFWSVFNCSSTRVSRSSTFADCCSGFSETIFENRSSMIGVSAGI
jgi:hypothetical protein